MLFSLFNPVFFVNRPDVTLNMVMLTDVQSSLLNNRSVRILFDAVYILLPIILVYRVFQNKFNRVLVLTTLFFHLVYCLILSSMSGVSAETFVAWMTVAIIFYATTSKGFYYLLQILRLFFLIIFFSAGLWKLRTGAVFNTEQMSAVLLWQHASYLAGSTETYYGKMILFLINHVYFSYALYLATFFAEISFAIGFFTRKYDRYLIVFFCLFLLFDYIIMGINYSAWLAFTGSLYFSRYRLPGVKGRKITNEDSLSA